jgi:hypothetical protein
MSGGEVREKGEMTERACLIELTPRIPTSIGQILVVGPNLVQLDDLAAVIFKSEDMKTGLDKASQSPPAPAPKTRATAPG